jgi:transposase InsO family protein
MFCNVSKTGETLLGKVRKKIPNLSSDSGAPTGLSEVRWTRTTVGGPNYLGGSVTAFLQEKSQTQETLKGFLRRAQNEFGLGIKKIRSDNGTEFKNSQIEGFLEEEGIEHEFSSPYTPQQNGVVERKNRTLLIWRGPCLMNTRLRIGFGRKQSTPLATPSTVSTFTESSRRHHTNS